MFFALLCQSSVYLVVAEMVFLVLRLALVVHLVVAVTATKKLKLAENISQQRFFREKVFQKE